MLTISQQARDVVRRIPDQPGLTGSAGLRIAATAADRSRMRVLAAANPRHGDRILDYDGASVFLDEHAFDLLEDRYVDVETGEDGRLHFLSVPQSDVRSDEAPTSAAA